jgi:hypothetical protein
MYIHIYIYIYIYITCTASSLPVDEDRNLQCKKGEGRKEGRQSWKERREEGAKG